ncbi:hypothetical protein BN129_3527 [Cronobacter sakazakii 701]|nr:hypothetical protein BN129_3527 [Cronobacter sakazakii 701]
MRCGKAVSLFPAFAPGYAGDASHPQLRQAGKPSFLLAQIRL